MKRIIILIGLVLASPILAQAQNAGWQIPPGANTPRAANTPGTPMNRANVDIWGNQLISLQSGTASATNPIKLEDSVATSGDAGIVSLGVINDTFATLAAAGDYTFLATGRAGNQLSTLVIDDILPLSRQVAKFEDAASASGDAGVAILAKRLDTPVSQAADSDYTLPLANDFSALYVDGTRRNPVVHSQPSIATATSTTIASASAARKFLQIQNNSAANIMVNFASGTLTGIVPTAANLGIVLVPGAIWTSPPNYSPVDNIRAYQTSGGTINTISVVEGF